MLRLTESEFKKLASLNLFGYICSQGVCVGDSEFVLEAKNEEYYLRHISDYQQDGLFIKEKEK